MTAEKRNILNAQGEAILPVVHYYGSMAHWGPYPQARPQPSNSEWDAFVREQRLRSAAEQLWKAARVVKPPPAQGQTRPYHCDQPSGKHPAYRAVRP